MHCGMLAWNLATARMSGLHTRTERSLPWLAGWVSSHFIAVVRVRLHPVAKPASAVAYDAHLPHGFAQRNLMTLMKLRKRCCTGFKA